MLLGSGVCPRVLFLGTDFYAMEHLSSAPLTPEMPRIVEEILAKEVWYRDPINGLRSDWRTQLFQTTGVSAPYWAFSEVEYCLTHGDPTLANVMMRAETDEHGGTVLSRHVILCDPVPPGRRVPQIREIDQSKIVQSMLGWEAMIGGICLLGSGEWQEPDFLVHGSELSVRRLMFWTGISMLRCHQHLDRDKERLAWLWCWIIEKEMLRAAGV